MSEYNDKIVAEFRANGGRVDSAGFGTHLVLIHTTGARTGAGRVNPAMSIRDSTRSVDQADDAPDSWLVIASAMGAPTDPAWAVNLRAHPDTHIEVAEVDGLETVPVTAVELDGTDYEEAFARFVERSSAFTTYQERASERRLPVIRLTRRDDDADNGGGNAPAAQAALASAPESTLSPDAGPTEEANSPGGTGIGPDDLSRELVVARPDEDSLPHYGVVGDTYTMLITGEQTQGRYALIDMFVPPEGGPPPHRHDFEEMFHVLEGEFEVTFRGESLVLKAGETINIPARAPHFFHNTSGHDARVLCMVSPAGLEEYFTLWGLPLPTRTSTPTMSDPESKERLSTAINLGPRYGIENLPPEG